MTENTKVNIYLKDVYKDWLMIQACNLSQKRINEIHFNWKRYIEFKNKLMDVPLIKIDTKMLEDYCWNLVRKNELTKEQFACVKKLLKDLFNYAIKIDVIATNPILDMDLYGLRYFKAELMFDEDGIPLIDEI